MNQQIERILNQVPGWNGVEAVVTPLVGGITNQNYRVDIRGETFELRIGGKGTHLLGIDRGRERTCTAIAAQMGIGAEVVHFLASESAEVLITRFIVGTSITPETAAQPEMMRRIVDSMHRYHGGPDLPGTFSPFETVRSYYKLALAHGVSFPDTLPQAFTLMTQIEQAVAGDRKGPPIHPYTPLAPTDQPTPCHNDLLASNFIDDGHTIRILDWEYAGMGDRFFDLGNFAVNQSLNQQQCEFLLRYYFGEVRPADVAHLHLMRLGSDLRESFWGFLQLGISELDFDYSEYAHHHLNRFLRNVDTPRFEQWLQDVRH